jgi:hypothetical protein
MSVTRKVKLWWKSNRVEERKKKRGKYCTWMAEDLLPLHWLPAGS